MTDAEAINTATLGGGRPTINIEVVDAEEINNVDPGGINDRIEAIND